MPSAEFTWFQEMAESLAQRYAFQWIAVNGSQIGSDLSTFDKIVVGTGDSLGEALEMVRQRNLDPLDLFYVFVRPPLGVHLRQKGI
jgi:hypothetical protein